MRWGLTKEQIGVEAPFGSAAALARFTEMTARRRFREGNRPGFRNGCAKSTATPSCR